MHMFLKSELRYGKNNSLSVHRRSRRSSRLHPVSLIVPIQRIQTHIHKIQKAWKDFFLLWEVEVYCEGVG